MLKKNFQILNTFLRFTAIFLPPFQAYTRDLLDNIFQEYLSSHYSNKGIYHNCKIGLPLNIGLIQTLTTSQLRLFSQRAF